MGPGPEAAAARVAPPETAFVAANGGGLGGGTDAKLNPVGALVVDETTVMSLPLYLNVADSPPGKATVNSAGPVSGISSLTPPGKSNFI